jgi:mRNA-degrading endonuclease RelE of RelBE toxin-antitoxin system
MQFRVELTAAAESDLRQLRAYQRAIVLDAVARALREDANSVARNRKPLRSTDPMRTPAWEYRVGDIRIFYDVDVSAETVLILRIRRKGRKTTAEVIDETDDR